MAAGAPRSVVRVAAGVLRRADGAVLLAQRPAGKIAAGRWEFPGGKIEAGESPREALERELAEEIGVRVQSARPLLCLRHAYTERTVELDTWLVEAWAGQAEGLENQALAWVQPAEMESYDVLEADGPIIDALKLPCALPITADRADADALLADLLRLAADGHRLIRLRAPRLSEEAYTALAMQAGPRLHALGSGLLIDRWQGVPAGTAGIAGVHLTAAAAQRIERSALPDAGWLFASCHNRAELERACALGAQALVIGPVHATATHPGAQILGLDGFAQLAAQANRPCYGLGGLAVSDAEAVFQRGGQGVAGISAYQRPR